MDFSTEMLRVVMLNPSTTLMPPPPTGLVSRCDYLRGAPSLWAFCNNMGSIKTPGQSLPKPPAFVLKNEPVENQRRVKVRVVGAGYSGIYLGIRIPQRLRNVDLRIYEKNEGVGGTWRVNRYPGCACDIPAHSYQYSFDPNPHWSAFYASQPEIRAYLERMAEKYGVMRFIKLSHEVESCRWDQDAKKW